MHLERCFYFHSDIVDPVFSFINHIIFAPVTYTLYHMNHAQYILLLKSLGITEQRPTHTKVLHIIYSIFAISDKIPKHTTLAVMTKSFL